MRTWWLAGLAACTCVAVASAQDSKTVSGLVADAELVETRMAVPKPKAAAAYEPKDNILDVELSEYAGYAGLIVANGGLNPNDESFFAKKYGFKLKIKLSEEDSWSALNSGRLAASATTVDVLPLYGRQLEVVVPLLIGFSRGADSLVVMTQVRQINDLKGKTLAMCQFNESDFFTRYLAQQANIELNMLPDLSTKPAPDKINVVFCADSFGAGDIFLRDLQAGKHRIHGCVTWEPKTSEVVSKSSGKAKVLVSNRNLLVIADVLIVNKGFATAHPDMVKGLVDGILHGNQLVRQDPKSCAAVLAAALKWKDADVPDELQKVHLANLPENLAFFGGTIDSAGSYGYIYESSAQAYGSQFIPNPFNGEKFLNLKHLKTIESEGKYRDQKASLKPIRINEGAQPEQPLLAKDVRFLFEPNSSKVDVKDAKNITDFELLTKMLQVSPGSSLLLRGHVDNSRVKEFERQGGPQLVQKMALKAMQLSKERCESVKQALVTNYKVDSSRVDVIGRGWEEPLGADMDQNRRVEVHWFTLE